MHPNCTHERHTNTFVWCPRSKAHPNCAPTSYTHTGSRTRYVFAAVCWGQRPCKLRQDKIPSKVCWCYTLCLRWRAQQKRHIPHLITRQKCRTLEARQHCSHPSRRKAARILDRTLQTRPLVRGTRGAPPCLNRGLRATTWIVERFDGVA